MNVPVHCPLLALPGYLPGREMRVASNEKASSVDFFLWGLTASPPSSDSVPSSAWVEIFQRLRTSARELCLTVHVKSQSTDQPEFREAHRAFVVVSTRVVLLGAQASQPVDGLHTIVSTRLIVRLLINLQRECCAPCPIPPQRQQASLGLPPKIAPVLRSLIVAGHQD